MADAPTILITPQQRAAIELRDASVALSAGAGCGKTSVLTKRFLAHLEPGDHCAQLHQLIAITFTERAAREMRDRVRREVRQRLDGAGGPEAEHWLALLRKLHTARISTIHSFCSTLLRAHAAEAGLDPGFRTLDDLESGNLLQSAIDDELRRRLSDHDEPTLRLAADFGLARLRSMIQQLVRSRDPIPFDDWLRTSPSQLIEQWSDCHRSLVLPSLVSEFVSSRGVRRLLRLLRENRPTNRTMQDRRAALLDLLPGLTASDDLAERLQEIRENARVQGGGNGKAWEAPEIYEDVRDSCAEIREAASELERFATLDAAAAVPAAEAGLDLLALCQGAHERYHDRKHNRQSLDFDDLLRAARDFLAQPTSAELRRRLAANTELLLVDEFQDTDQVQVELIKLLCDGDVAGGKLFFVGDLKQSIYRFRGADPGVFHGLRDEIPQRGQLPLAQNFRSQPAIVDFANALFCDELNHGAAYEALRPARKQITPEPAIEFLWAVSVESSDRSEQLRKLEADWIARRLRQLIDSGAAIVGQRGSDDSHTARPVRPGDIALLFRALSDVEYYEAALRRYDLPYYLVGGHAFYSQQEVFDLVNLLRAIVAPADEVSLAGVLRSPFFSLRDETLFWLAQHRDGLAAGLFAETAPATLDGAERALVDNARSILIELRGEKDRLSVAELINRALDATGYDAVLLSEFLGERKLANLRKLIEMARRFDQSGLFTLDDFIAQLAESVANQPQEALAATQAESTTAIRIMTIHQSKGLEFPVVVIPDIDRPNRQSTSEGVAFDKRLGPVVRLPQGIPGAGALCGFDLYSCAESEADLAELARLFYVAVTRAADYLIVSSGVKRIGAGGSAWSKLLAERFDLETGACLATLPEGMAAPKVLVTKQPPPRPSQSESHRAANLIELVEDARQLNPRQAKAIVSRTEPIPPALHLRRQFSFSRLTGHLRADHDEETAIERSADEGSAGIDPLRFGAVVHAVLSELSSGATLDVNVRVRHHAELHLREAPAAIDAAQALIERFMASPRAAAIASAQAAYTELEFLLAWPPGEASGNGVYLQGYIDCLYRDQAGHWHLVDYKTNRVPAESVPAAAKAYEMQMLVYGLAAEQVLGEPPASLALHFLQPGAEYEIVLDDASRARARRLVEEGIRAAQRPVAAV